MLYKTINLFMLISLCSGSIIGMGMERSPYGRPYKIPVTTGQKNIEELYKTTKKIIKKEKNTVKKKILEQKEQHEKKQINVFIKSNPSNNESDIKQRYSRKTTEIEQIKDEKKELALFMHKLLKEKAENDGTKYIYNLEDVTNVLNKTIYHSLSNNRFPIVTEPFKNLKKGKKVDREVIEKACEQLIEDLNSNNTFINMITSLSW